MNPTDRVRTNNYCNDTTAYLCILSKLSSTYCSHLDGGVGAVERVVSSKCSIYKLAAMGDTGDPMAELWARW